MLHVYPLRHSRFLLKRPLLLLLSWLLSAAAWAQAPANDEPCNAAVLTSSGQVCAAPVTGSTQGATVTPPAGYSNTTSCGTGFGQPRDVWYSFTTAASGLGSTGATLTVTGNAAGQLRLFAAPGCTGPFTEIACQAASQSNTPAPALSTTTLTPNTTYYVRVASGGSTTPGPFSICLTDGPGSTPGQCGAPVVGLPVFSADNTTATLSISPGANTTPPYTATLQVGTGPVQTYTVPGTSLVLPGLVPGTLYRLTVLANCPSGGRTGTVVNLPVPPLNDEPCRAQALPLSPGAGCTATSGATSVSTTTAPTGYANPGCGGATQPTDVWYTVTTTAAGPGSTSLVLSVSNVAAAGQLRLFAAASCAGPFTELACSTGQLLSDGALPLTATGLVPNTTYYISVAPSGNRPGGFFTICASALPPVLPCLAPTLNVLPDLLTPTTAQIAIVPPTGAPRPPLYTLIYTRLGGRPDTLRVPASAVLGDPATLAFLSGLVPASSYTVVVRAECGSGSQSVSVTTTFTTPPAASTPPPSNDDCANAQLLPVNTSCTPTLTTNLNATTSPVAEPACGYYLGADVWYRLVVPPNGIVQVTTGAVAGSAVDDTGLALYAGSCGQLTEVDCNDDPSPGNLFAQVRGTDLTPGSTVYARMWRTGSTTGGAFTICATTDVTCPVVSSLAASNLDQTTATLTFGLPGGGSYQLSYAAAGGGAVQTQSISASPVVLSNLTPGTTYTARLTNTCGSALPSTVSVTFTTLPVPTCPAPPAVYISNVGSTAAGLGFVPTGAASYRVTYQAAAGPVLSVTPDPTASPVVLTGLQPGTSYTVCVTARCANGLTATPVCAPAFTTASTAPACLPPTGASVTSLTATSASISFVPVSGGSALGYTATATPTTGGAAVQGFGTTTPVLLSGLSANTTYTVQVVAHCPGSAVSPPTQPLSFATPLSSRTNLLAAQLGLFPNPAQQATTLIVPATLLRQSAHLTLTDALGRIVRQHQLPATRPGSADTRVELNLRGLSPGVYLLRLPTSAGPVVKRLVLE